MKQLMCIALDEWRYWSRSYLAVCGVCIFAILIIATSVFTHLDIAEQNHTRSHQQETAEETFLAQPDRHPHRMVHYGHYVFRAPAPLAIFDPGLNNVTGQAIFLEGHRQNTPTFAESGASANLGGLAWLTPAVVYQLFAPFIIILLGHAAIAREREASTIIPLLSMGLSGTKLIAGKALALFALTLILLIPLTVNCAIAFIQTESFLTVMYLFSHYLMYLTIWVLITLWCSILFEKRSTILAALAGIWFTLTLVVPSAAVNLATNSASVSGKIDTDLAMLAEARKLGDGHNANDPAFAAFRKKILKQYNVESIEQLPVNFRGLVASEGERKLTLLLKEFSDKRMTQESKQAQHLAQYGWFSPMLSISFISRSLSGTDLYHYHQFQREAESLRYDFVQSLNKSHIDKLSYQDDMNRNKDKASGLRARVDASNWQVLDHFEFSVADLSTRVSQAASNIFTLTIWLVVLFIFLFLSSRRLKP